MLICKVALGFNQKESIWSLLTMMQIHVNLDHKSTLHHVKTVWIREGGQRHEEAPVNCVDCGPSAVYREPGVHWDPQKAQDRIEDFTASLQCRTSIMKNSKTLLYLHYG